MKILWAKANKILPVHSGGDIRSYNIARELAAQHEYKEPGTYSVVVKVIVERFIVPELMRSTLRCTVSPGPMPDALTLRRFVDAPVAPS